MNDHQRIIDRIQALLTAAVDPPPDEVRTLNDEFLEAVAAINDRLRRCDDLLRKGLRAEALQHCEADPNLLDAVAVLDFPEWNDWANYVNALGIDAPPELQLETAGELNEAYALEQPLERLMGHHRLLALARAPLTDRIGVMRRIRQLDGQNALWEQDLRTFERERLTQVRHELDRAARAGEVPALAGIETELRQPDWIEKPPAKVLSQAAQAHSRARAVHARSEMQRLERELTAAFSELDVARGRQARQRWNALQQIAELPATDPLAEMAVPALEWLRGQDHRAALDSDYQHAVAELERTIEHEAPREELDRAWHAVVKTERELPPLLQRRFDERRRYLDDRARRKNQLLIAASITALLAVGAVVTLYIRQQTQAAEVAEHGTNLAALVEAGKLPEAERYVAALEPWVARQPGIERLRADIQAAVRKDDGRQAELRTLLAKARTIGLSQPDWDSLASAAQEVDRAETIASSEAERAQIEQLRSDLWRARNGLQQAVDQQYDGDVEALQQRIGAVPDGDVAALDAVLAEARELTARPRVSEARKTSLPGLVNMLVAKREAALRDRARSLALSAITAAVGDERAYREALEAYTHQFPDTPRSAEFAKVVAEAPLWSGVRAWDKLRQEWSQTDWRTLSPQDAKRLLQQLDELRSRTSPVPMPSEMAVVRSVLEAIASRNDAEGNPAAERITVVLARKAIADVKMVLTRSGERYYVADEPRLFRDRWTLSYFSTHDLDSQSAKVLDRGDVLTDARGIIAVQAPQSRFAKYATRRLRDTGDDGWETVFVDVLERLHAEEQMDPMLKLLLYRLVLDTASTGSVPLREVFQEQRAFVEAISIDPAANWMHPHDDRARDARQKADAVLRKLSSPSLFKHRVEARVASLAKLDLGPERRWAGWLTRNADGRFVFRPKQSPSRQIDGELLVVYVVPEAAEASFHPVGRVTDGQVAMVQPQSGGTSPLSFLEGRPVFLVARSEG